MSPATIRVGTIIGEIGGTNAGDLRQRAVGGPAEVERQQRQPVGAHEQQGDRHHRGGQVLLARHERTDRRVGDAVERVPEQEPEDDERHGAGGARREAGAPRQCPGGECRAAGDRELAQTQQPDAEHLAGQQPARRHRREQQLDDPRRLLLGHADRHGVGEAHQRGEQGQDPDGHERLVVLVGLRFERGHGQRPRRQRLERLRLREPEAAEAAEGPLVGDGVLDHFDGGSGPRALDDQPRSVDECDVHAAVAQGAPGGGHPAQAVELDAPPGRARLEAQRGRERHRARADEPDVVDGRRLVPQPCRGDRGADGEDRTSRRALRPRRHRRTRRASHPAGRRSSPGPRAPRRARVVGRPPAARPRVRTPRAGRGR
jgi:hypothetical protein